MQLNIKTITKNDNIYLIKLSGSIDSDTHMKLEDELKRIIDAKIRALVLDMTGVDYISSIGIRTVVSAKKALEAKGASFAMANLNPHIKKVFDVMKILPMFDIFDGMPEADKYIDEIIKEEMGKTG